MMDAMFIGWIAGAFDLEADSISAFAKCFHLGSFDERGNKYGRDALQHGIQRLPFLLTRLRCRERQAPIRAEAVNRFERKEGEFRGMG